MSDVHASLDELRAQLAEQRQEIERLQHNRGRFRLPSTVRRMGGRGKAGLAIALIGLLAMAPALALAATFSDVSPSNTFYNDVEAIAAAGVTTGCGGGKYCPDDYVTRGQMAAFMNRLGALQAGKTPVVNAARLSGKTASAFHQYGTTAPALTTQYGAWSVEGQAAAALAYDAANISFPVPINATLTTHIVPAGGPVPSGCSGSVTAPAASAGNLCVFVGFSLNIHDTTLFWPHVSSDAASHYGAFIQTRATAAGSYVLSGTWAAKAPLTIIILPKPNGPVTQPGQ